MAKKEQNWHQDCYWNKESGIGPVNVARIGIHDSTVTRAELTTRTFNQTLCTCSGELGIVLVFADAGHKFQFEPRSSSAAVLKIFW
ncbi:hypothetical protein EVAR_99615_1 [Eumeta japonica]|uniref:Uncharacterized protein n=1 Tax=Eumeta variegata TaxID=151549 RepID=A0A4C1SG05_EUMVA|nr:hypothetical protein EVAR_99615_1 [Eumeta japonica]